MNIKKIKDLALAWGKAMGDFATQEDPTEDQYIKTVSKAHELYKQECLSQMYDMIKALEEAKEIVEDRYMLCCGTREEECLSCKRDGKWLVSIGDTNENV